MPGGRTVKICFIDLTDEKYRIVTTEPEPELIGGRGVNQRLLFDLQEPGVNESDPQNPLILGAGPLVGTFIPGASRLAVDFRNRITGGVGSANLGGHFAPEMKFAGFDNVVIQGRSNRLVYLYLKDGCVFFRDAESLRGFDTWETENRIKLLEKEPRLKTLCIGAAGENLVQFACIIGDRGRAAGYGGSGAVFGAKNLKAVAVRGTGSVTAAHPDALLSEVLRFNRETIEKSPFVRVHRQGGTLAAYLLPGENRPHAVRNMSRGFWNNETISRVDRATIDERYLVRRHACFACPIYCSAIYRVEGRVCEGLQANSWRAFASNLDVTDPEMVMRLHLLTNRLGLDGDHTSAVLAWAVECFENGLIQEGDTGGLKLSWSDGRPLLRLVEQIASRTGFGDVLAGGVVAAARHVGRGSERLTVTAQGNALMEAAMRSHKAWALGIITSTKGGGHLRGAPAVEAKRISPEQSVAYFGIADVKDPTVYENKADLVMWYENYKGVVDMMGLCYLPSMWMELGLFTPQQIARFYQLVTGINHTAEDLMNEGARLQVLEHLFNILHAGLDRNDVRPPEKLASIPVEEGPFKGQYLDPERWEEMLNDYYRVHGYDLSSGRPTRERVQEVDLAEAVERLEAAGIRLPSRGEAAGCR
ncbi:MAG: aldehyde ferredoxin oxidoreductase C-terminal domain-containing protein [Desulfatiglandaceae bacterium]